MFSFGKPSSYFWVFSALNIPVRWNRLSGNLETAIPEDWKPECQYPNAAKPPVEQRSLGTHNRFWVNISSALREGRIKGQAQAKARESRDIFRFWISEVENEESLFTKKCLSPFPGWIGALVRVRSSYPNKTHGFILLQIDLNHRPLS